MNNTLKRSLFVAGGSLCIGVLAALIIPTPTPPARPTATSVTPALPPTPDFYNQIPAATHLLTAAFADSEKAGTSPTLQLIGIVEQQGKLSALITEQESSIRPIRKKEGDTLPGNYTLLHIAWQSITLEKEGKTTTLHLYP